MREHEMGAACGQHSQELILPRCLPQAGEALPHSRHMAAVTHGLGGKEDTSHRLADELYETSNAFGLRQLSLQSFDGADIRISILRRRRM